MSCFDYPVDGAAILQKKRSLRRELLQRGGLVEKKIALLSGSTIGELRPVLELFLLNQGIKPIFYEGGYHLFYEQLMFDDRELADFAPDLLYIHTGSRNLENLPSPRDDAAAAAVKIEREKARWTSVWDAAAARFRCPVVINNFELPDLRVFGNADAVFPQGRVRFVRGLNDCAAEYAAAHSGFHLQDLAWLSSVCGLDRWYDESAWCLYKYAFSVEFIPEVCRNLSNIIKSIFGKNKKALALDLDNTLWGGVIGDDGAEGIHVGREDPEGMAYSAFQSYLRDLSGLGIVLNVCSKNDEATAREGFRVPGSVLKEDDFLCFKANWEPKDQNLAAIAQEINIGVKDIVFVDDNPAERERVRSGLPGVPVLELAAPEEYARALDRSGWFEVTAFSEDDRGRNRMYRENVQRALAQQSFSDYADYLRSLQMKAQIMPFAEGLVPRITQLINKTNQFNLTTRRYTEDEVRACMHDPASVTLCGRLEDRFGDNGLVTAVIGRIADDTLTVQLWIMSCRTFKRDLEYAMFDTLVQAAQAAGCRRLRGVYRPTARNGIVRDFYPSLGFLPESESPEETTFILGLEKPVEKRNQVIELLPDPAAQK